MMVSGLVAIFKNYLSLPAASLVFIIFILAGTAVLSHRLARSIEGVFALTSLFALAFIFAATCLEKSEELHTTALALAVFCGVGRVAYERLASER
jgi:hypothetical protein